MKLIFAVVQESDLDDILSGLADANIQSTLISSAGGFLREANATLILGIDEAEVANAIRIIDANSTTRQAFVNPLMPVVPVLTPADASSVRVGASVFVVNVDRFIRVTE